MASTGGRGRRPQSARSEAAVFNRGSRRLQDAFETTALADFLAEGEARARLSSEDAEIVRRSCFFFLATADKKGRPLCAYKGGMPGFVKILGERTLAFPDYDGNGTFRSLGNVLENPHVALFFIDFERGERLLVEGKGSVSREDTILAEWPGAQLVTRVAVTRAFSCCPRYIHKMTLIEHSAFVPREGHAPPVPAWKKDPAFKDVLPPRDRVSPRVGRPAQPRPPRERRRGI